LKSKKVLCLWFGSVLRCLPSRRFS